MKLFKLLGTTLLAICLSMSLSCSTNSQVKEYGEMHCPETALEERPGPVGEIPRDYQGVKLKLAEVIKKYRTLSEQDATLLACWHREADKRKGPD
jgi:hypothetical protein